VRIPVGDPLWNEKESLYAILGVEPEADDAEIKLAERLRSFEAQRKAPDSTKSEEAKERLQRIHKAAMWLRDKDIRAAYDESRKERSDSHSPEDTKVNDRAPPSTADSREPGEPAERTPPTIVFDPALVDFGTVKSDFVAMVPPRSTTVTIRCQGGRAGKDYEVDAPLNAGIFWRAEAVDSTDEELQREGIIGRCRFSFSWPTDDVYGLRTDYFPVTVDGGKPFRLPLYADLKKSSKYPPPRDDSPPDDTHKPPPRTGSGSARTGTPTKPTSPHEPRDHDKDKLIAAVLGGLTAAGLVVALSVWMASGIWNFFGDLDWDTPESSEQATTTIGSSTTVDRAARTDVAVSAAVSPNQIDSFDEVTYSITLTNSGPDPATGITVRFGLEDAGGSFMGNVSAGCTIDGSASAVCDVGTLDAGASTRVDLPATIAIPFIPGEVVAQVVSDSGATDINTENDRASVVVNVNGPAFD
jgi:curved DNA-binding protein CbpA